jgi:hypothetical protein
MLILNVCLTNREVEGKRGPVAAKACHAPPNPNDFLFPSAPIIVKIGVVLFSVGSWHEEPDVLSEKVLLLISEEGTSGRVYGPDATTRIDGNNAVDCRLKGGAKKRFIPQRFGAFFSLVG